MMASTSVGSDAAFAIGLLVLSLLVLLLLRHYLPLRSTPAYLLLPIFLALFLPASVILLVPIDLASSATTEDGMPRGIWLPERARLVCWRIAYWLIFSLTWFILPILGQYSDSGDREPRQRLIYSLKSNGRFQLIMLSVGILASTYGFVASQLNLQTFKSMIMALPYAWGLTIAIYLMGHGLVAFPRKLYRSANLAGRLRQVQIEATRIHERWTDSVEDLQVLESQVLQLRKRKTGTAMRYQDWIEDLVDTSDMPESRINLVPPSRIAEGVVPVVVTERYLADLTRNLKRARHRRIRFVQEWDRCVQEAKRLQDILDASGSRKLEAGLPGEFWFQKAKFVTPGMRYYLHASIIPAVRMSFSIIFAISSICLAWSEVIPRLIPEGRIMADLSIVQLSIIHHPNDDERGKIGFAGQVMTGCWMIYMMTCTLTSIREVKVWGNRALVTRHTYAESACWYASQVARLTVPLSYNFTSLIPGIVEHTQFYKFLGQSIDLTPLGEGFSNYFPVLIIIPICASAFNLYGKVKSVFGYGGFVEDEEENPNGYGTGGWREGKTLIDRELHNANSLGLASRVQSPRPPSIHSVNAMPPPSTLPTYRDRPNSPPIPSSRPMGRPTPRGTLPPEDSDNDGNFFSDFAHRVRNTVDTFDKPTWVPNIEFKKPKWMRGSEAESSGDAERSQGIGGWFGGGRDNGKLRL